MKYFRCSTETQIARLGLVQGKHLQSLYDSMSLVSYFLTIQGVYIFHSQKYEELVRWLGTKYDDLLRKNVKIRGKRLKNR